MSKILKIIYDALKDRFSTKKIDYELCEAYYECGILDKKIILVFRIQDRSYITKNEVLRGIRDAIDRKLTEEQK